MANINIRGLSDHTKEGLRVRAAQAGMSLEAFARRTLQKALVDDIGEDLSIIALADTYFGDAYGIDLDIPKRKMTRESVELA